MPKKTFDKKFIIENLKDAGYEPTEKGWDSLDKVFKPKKKRSPALRKLYKNTPTYNPKTGKLEL